MLPTLRGKMTGFVCADGVPALSPSHEEHLQIVYVGRYADLSDLSSFAVEMSKRCDLTVMTERFSSLNYAIGLQNNSPYEELSSKG